MESEWKCEAGKSLCCLFIFSFQNLRAAFSSTFKVGTAWKHGACCICAHSAALYYFLWTTTTANHHGKQPLTAVCTLSPCSTWWKAQGPGCFSEKHRNRQMVIFVTWMMLGGGVIYERSGFCPIGWEEHFPTVSRLVCWPLPPVRCDSPPAAVCHHSVKYRPAVASCCTEMHHTPSLSVGENMSTLAARAHTAPERCDTLSRPRLPTPDKGSFFHNESSNLHRNWI